MATVDTLLTAEEYGRLPDNGRPTELVRGRIIEMNSPYPRHGEICSKVDRIVGYYIDEHQLGRLVTNDAGVITEEEPDTVRGADIAFYSYARIPPGPLPQGYLRVKPELIFEVRSSEDRWSKILAKVAEYLAAGVSVVCVLDPSSETVHVFYADRPVQILTSDQELTLPGILGDFRVVVRRFFE
jgi:Uma2 family endonuclease